MLLQQVKDLFTRNVFSPCPLLLPLLNVFFFIVIRKMEKKIDPSPNLSNIHTITIGTMLNFNYGNKGLWIKILWVSRP